MHNCPFVQLLLFGNDRESQPRRSTLRLDSGVPMTASHDVSSAPKTRLHRLCSSCAPITYLPANVRVITGKMWDSSPQWPYRKTMLSSGPCVG